jgi:hypothetical protein
MANYQEGLVHLFMLQQVFEEGVRRNCRIMGDGVALPDVKHYGQSRVRGVGDMVGGCETLSRQPGGLVRVMGKRAWVLRHGKPSQVCA